MKIKTYLDNKGKERSIYYRISMGAYTIVDGKKKYRQITYYTGKTINPKYWNKKLQAPTINNSLESILSEGKKEIRKMYLRLDEENNLSFESLQEAINTSENLKLIFNKEKEIVQAEEYIAGL